MIRSTSREAYESVLPKLGEHQKAVLTVLKEAAVPMTNREIADTLGWEINTVTPRCLELREAGLVKEVGECVSAKTGRKATQWGIAERKVVEQTRFEWQRVVVNGVPTMRKVAIPPASPPGSQPELI